MPLSTFFDGAMTSQQFLDHARDMNQLELLSALQTILFGRQRHELMA
jgi:hypothetical protein